jgi:hypothetical protein
LSTEEIVTAAAAADHFVVPSGIVTWPMPIGLIRQRYVPRALTISPSTKDAAY